MTEFRVGLEAISHLSFDDLSRVFHETCDGVITQRDGRVTAFVYAEADTALDAACRTIAQLETVGLSVVRTDPDLVDGPEIASRLGMTRQAIQNYAKGNRGAAFPRSIGAPGGKRIWAWGQITEWLASQGRLTEPPSLTLDEAARIDGMLAERRSAVTSPSRKSLSISVDSDFLTWPGEDEERDLVVSDSQLRMTISGA